MKFGIDIFKLTEPQFSKDILLTINNAVVSSPFLSKIVPITADFFVFFYPIILGVLYRGAMIKKSIETKIRTLKVFFASMLTFIFNFSIQFFVDKSRPEQFLDAKHSVLLKHIPDESFPSDHAALSSAFAMTLTYRALASKDRRIAILAIVCWIGSLIMSLSRIAVGVHWPTDIIAGTIVGIISATLVVKYGNSFCVYFVKIEERIFSLPKNSKKK